MTPYAFDAADRFVITDYNLAKPFASFLPGIAGRMGIPLWAFYVNRGQGIASFGIQDKDNSIMEYYPANKSYQLVSTHGFRTFLKVQLNPSSGYYEPFSPDGAQAGRQENMYISPNALEIEETNPELGLRVNVVYFLLPNESFAGLVRQVTISNLASRNLELELLDGMPAVVPYGVTHRILKEMSNTAMAWMGVENLEQGVPFYRLRASPDDSPEVEKIEAGYFYLAFSQAQGTSRLLPAIVDPAVVFGQNTSLSRPDAFVRGSLAELRRQKQVTSGRTPCGFFGTSASLAPGESLQVNSIIGQISDIHIINTHRSRLMDPAYIETKRQEAATLVSALTDRVATHTSNHLFDLYCRQTYLDNTLRGGMPILLDNGKEPFVYHLYSRKHGDLERDYNFFSVLPEFYSQGEANYRDVNQNRRSDVLLDPHVERFNILAFMNLIQADGYNPLLVKGSTFLLDSQKVAGVLRLVESGADQMGKFLTRPYRPGQLIKYAMDHGIVLKVSPEEFLRAALEHSEQFVDGAFGDGYWVDHWSYNQDLIESYLSIYPDRREDLLFGKPELTYFDSAAAVLPRAEKYVLVGGKARQLGTVTENKEKKEMIDGRASHPNRMRVKHGRGDVYRATLGAKLLCLALNKFALLDPWGMGIEMEAGRPGWCDALNGLPGLFGSSMAETYALRRLLQFLLDAFRDPTGPALRLPVEVHRFLMTAGGLLTDYRSMPEGERDHRYWEGVGEAREAYRREILFGFEGPERELPLPEAGQILRGFLQKVDEGIAKAVQLNGGLYPTYFYYEAVEYEPLQDGEGNPKRDAKNRPCVRVKRFRPVTMPLFLEGVVRAMRLQPSRVEARRLYQAVRESELYDRKLKMYRVNASLKNQPYDIGRIKAFALGWLENESIFLHMEYKYLLEVLRAGLYEEYFQDLRTCLIPFQNPAVYGRSPLENSTFLASSAHADETMHGEGFVARLSGSTVEFLTMWSLMMAGPTPFLVKDHQLYLEFKPILPGWLFDGAGTVVFRFLGACDVTYHNPRKLDTFAGNGPRARQILIHQDDATTAKLSGGVIGEPYASRVRSGRVKSIEVFLEPED
jgi:hypothetical protein